LLDLQFIDHKPLFVSLKMVFVHLKTPFMCISLESSSLVEAAFIHMVAEVSVDTGRVERAGG